MEPDDEDIVDQVDAIGVVRKGYPTRRKGLPAVFKKGKKGKRCIKWSR